KRWGHGRRLRWSLGRRRLRLFHLCFLHQIDDRTLIGLSRPAGLLEIVDRLLVLASAKIRDSTVIIWMIIDEDISVRSCVVLFFRPSRDGGCHFLDDDLPAARVYGLDAVVVLV